MFDKVKQLQNEIKEFHSRLDNIKDSKNIEKYNKLNEIQKMLYWIENDAVGELFSGKGENDINKTIIRLEGIRNSLKFLIEAEKK